MRTGLRKLFSFKRGFSNSIFSKWWYCYVNMTPLLDQPWNYNILLLGKENKALFLFFQVIYAYK